MTLKIDDAIEEIERALAGNKPKYANDIYLNNAIRYLQEIKAPSLSDDQQVVLEWLKWQSKQNGTDPTDSIYLLVYGEAPSSVSTALIDLTKAQQFQVLAAFAEWGMKEVAQ